MQCTWHAVVTELFQPIIRQEFMSCAQTSLCAEDKKLLFICYLEHTEMCCHKIEQTCYKYKPTSIFGASLGNSHCASKGDSAGNTAISTTHSKFYRTCSTVNISCDFVNIQHQSPGTEPSANNKQLKYWQPTLAIDINLEHPPEDDLLCQSQIARSLQHQDIILMRCHLPNEI